MNGPDALTTIAEVALGLAGFSGVVVVLGKPPDQFTRVDLGRLTVLLMSSLGAMFFGLLPFALSPLGFNDSTVWRISGTLLAIFATAHIGLSYSQLRRVQREAPEIYSPSAYTIHFSLLLGILVLQLFNVSKGGQLGLSLYIFGLMALLVVAALQFLRILFVRTE